MATPTRGTRNARNPRPAPAAPSRQPTTPERHTTGGPAAARAAAPRPAVPAQGRLKVRALAMGFYNNKRRREGDVFVIEAQHFTQRWMEPVDASTPPSTTTGLQHLKRQHDERLAQTQGGRTPAQDEAASDEDEGIFE